MAGPGPAAGNAYLSGSLSAKRLAHAQPNGFQSAAQAEGQSLSTHTSGARYLRGSWRKAALVACAVASFILVACWTRPEAFPFGLHTLDRNKSYQPNGDASACPQAAAFVPEKHGALVKHYDDILGSDAFKRWAYASLGGAVQIPTVTFDDMGLPGEDPRWETRLTLHEYLTRRFPHAHRVLKKTVVNHYGLSFHWQGSEASLKPILMTGHQDVAPVDPETEHEWTHPPFSGYFDGDRIWGRGSGDDKSGVIGILTAVETLLDAGFQPYRTVVFAFGMDEERGGKAGGPAMQSYLLDTYGKGGFAMLLDEGYGTEARDGRIFSTPAVSEKGMTNVRLDVTTQGGHPMVPPRHTSIGILSSIIHALEHDAPAVRLQRSSPTFASLLCSATHDDAFPSHLRPLVQQAREHDAGLRPLTDALLEMDPDYWGAVLGTTQAVDLIGGGVKANALPRSAWAVVDHRIADWSSVEEVRSRYRHLLRPLIDSYNLTLDAFGDGEPSKDYNVRLTTAYGIELEPSPVTPTTGHKPWNLLSGVIKDSLAHTQKEVVVSPVVALGNTDTRHYWPLTKHIFRYSHIDATGYQGAHDVDEAIRGEAFIEMIRFYGRLILAADEGDLEE
ncbi:carboxypeptidase S [Gloeopeniophorella convolvens]|nr:carboxypeptidase S [Gloeopeniophorella convolvens]